jgi:hypothetical protein
MKKLVYLITLLVFVGSLPVHAQRNRRNGAAQKAAAEKRKKEEAEKAKKEKINNEIEAFVKDRDRNRDKSLTLEEFLSGESDAKAGEAKFQEYNKNKDRYLSKTEVQELLGL